HQTALADKQQRQTEIAERQQEVAQQREQNRAENAERQNQVEQIHQTALADKQQRQTEVAERRQYVWGDQAGVTPSPIAQPMKSQNGQHSHQENDHQG
ncbi:MAG: hypothetical protein MGG11_07090, partial [Trichodesmium sp. MAG_R03]|nr:hypothetical protein [Trichodesmium sp. MAG_R03]